MDVLDDTGLSENTVVVFLSDHGENTANHRTTLKTTFYNESCKIPMAIYNPSCKSGRTFTQPMSIMDIFPTICEYANIDKPGKLTEMSSSTEKDFNSLDTVECIPEAARWAKSPSEN